MPRLYAKLAAVTYTTLLIVTLLAVLVTRLIGGAAVARAYAGVTHNADWTPVVGTSPQGIEYVLVPAGCFAMGNDPRLAAEYGGADGGAQCFDEPFWISRTEISNAQYQRCVEAGMCESSSCAGDPGFNGAQQPVVCVNWFQAEAFAAWAGARLPSEAAWEYAARGPDERLLPWGNEAPTCDSANYWGRDGDCVGATSPVGSYSPVGDSWTGAADFAGNAWEWTSTLYADYPYDTADGREDANDSSAARVLRGGSWLNAEDVLRAAYRFRSNPNFRNLNVGFRCARLE